MLEFVAPKLPKQVRVVESTIPGSVKTKLAVARRNKAKLSKNWKKSGMVIGLYLVYQAVC